MKIKKIDKILTNFCKFSYEFVSSGFPLQLRFLSSPKEKQLNQKSEKKTI